MAEQRATTHAESAPSSAEPACLVCGKPLVAPATGGRTPKFCTPKHRAQYHREQQGQGKKSKRRDKPGQPAGNPANDSSSKPVAAGTTHPTLPETTALGEPAGPSAGATAPSSSSPTPSYPESGSAADPRRASSVAANTTPSHLTPAPAADTVQASAAANTTPTHLTPAPAADTVQASAAANAAPSHLTPAPAADTDRALSTGAISSDVPAPPLSFAAAAERIHNFSDLLLDVRAVDPISGGVSSVAGEIEEDSACASATNNSDPATGSTAVLDDAIPVPFATTNSPSVQLAEPAESFATSPAPLLPDPQELVRHEPGASRVVARGIVLDVPVRVNLLPQEVAPASNPTPSTARAELEQGVVAPSDAEAISARVGRRRRPEGAAAAGSDRRFPTGSSVGEADFRDVGSAGPGQPDSTEPFWLEARKSAAALAAAAEYEAFMRDERNPAPPDYTPTSDDETRVSGPAISETPSGTDVDGLTEGGSTATPDWLAIDEAEAQPATAEPDAHNVDTRPPRADPDPHSQEAQRIAGGSISCDADIQPPAMGSGADNAEIRSPAEGLAAHAAEVEPFAPGAEAYIEALQPTAEGSVTHDAVTDWSAEQSASRQPNAQQPADDSNGNVADDQSSQAPGTNLLASPADGDPREADTITADSADARYNEAQLREQLARAEYELIGVAADRDHFEATSRLLAAEITKLRARLSQEADERKRADEARRASEEELRRLSSKLSHLPEELARAESLERDLEAEKQSRMRAETERDRLLDELERMLDVSAPSLPPIAPQLKSAEQRHHPGQ